MKSTIRSRAIKTFLLSGILLCATASATAQESDVDVMAPPRITQDLISRNELNRLLNQPTQDRNPLRSTMPQALGRPLPGSVPNTQAAQAEPETQSAPRTRQQNAILDPNVQPTSWQDDQPNEILADDQAQQPSATFGPMPSFEMRSLWSTLDMLIEIPIDKLKKEIADRRTAIQSSLSMDDESKAARMENIEIAETAVEQATKHAARRDEMQNRMLSLKPALEQLRQESKKSAEPSPIDHALPVDSMQVILRDLQTELDAEIAFVSKIEGRIQERDDRMAGIPLERLQSRNQVNEFHELFLQKQAQGTEDIEVLLALRAQELAASTHIQLLDAEDSWHDQSQEKLPLEKSIHQRQLQRLEQEITAWNNAMANRKRAVLAEQIRIAKQQAFETHPDLQEFSKETTKLAEARAKLAEKIGALQNEKLKVSQQLGEVQRQFESLDTSIRNAGKEESRGLLIDVHRNLIRPYEGMARIQDMASEKKLTLGSILKLRAEQERVADSTTFIREQLKIEHDEQVADTTLIAMAEEAIDTHNKLLVALVGDYEEYQGLMGDLLPERESLLKKIAATRELVDTHALWVQSADPFSVALITKSGQGAQEFFDYQQWRELGNSIIHRVTHRPYECAVGMFGLLVAFVVGRRFKG